MLYNAEQSSAAQRYLCIVNSTVLIVHMVCYDDSVYGKYFTIHHAVRSSSYNMVRCVTIRYTLWRQYGAIL